MMVDKELLEAIGQMMEAQGKRLSDVVDTKLAQQKAERVNTQYEGAT